MVIGGPQNRRVCRSFDLIERRIADAEDSLVGGQPYSGHGEAGLGDLPTDPHPLRPQAEVGRLPRTPIPGPVPGGVRSVAVVGVGLAGRCAVLRARPVDLCVGWAVHLVVRRLAQHVGRPVYPHFGRTGLGQLRRRPGSTQQLAAEVAAVDKACAVEWAVERNSRRNLRLMTTRPSGLK